MLSRSTGRTILHKVLDRIGEMFGADVMIAAFNPQTERFDENIRLSESDRRFEFVTREFDLEAVRIMQVNRIHETAIAFEKFDASFAEARRNLLMRGA